MATDKPRHRSGYTPDELEQVKSTCLTVAVTLGPYLGDIRIVGGLVPALLIDSRRGEDSRDHDLHPGTNDLDVGLALALLDERRYAEVSARLRAEGFQPDTNDRGAQTVQRWKLPKLNVTIDFLIPPTSDADDRVRVRNLEGDFGALITPGLDLAIDERVDVELHGHTLTGEKATRTIPVCGPAAFVALKALAFSDRGEPKDAYDLVYVIRHTPGRGPAIAERLARHAENHAPIVAQALAHLARDFDSTTAIGPQRAARFALASPAAPSDLDDESADAHGHVDDILRTYERL